MADDNRAVALIRRLECPCGIALKVKTKARKIPSNVKHIEKKRVSDFQPMADKERNHTILTIPSKKKTPPNRRFHRRLDSIFRFLSIAETPLSKTIYSGQPPFFAYYSMLFLNTSKNLSIVFCAVSFCLFNFLRSTNISLALFLASLSVNFFGLFFDIFRPF